MVEKAPEHWSSRAGLRPGRTFYSWQIAFADAPQIVALHASYAALLEDLPGFAPVPLQQLYLDVQGIGFADRVPDQDLTAIINATRHRLTGLGAIPVTVGPATLTADSIQLPVRPIAPLQHLRELTQAAIVDVWGDDSFPEYPHLDPHVLLAHSNKAAPSAATRLGDHPPLSTALPITALSLLSIIRNDDQYRWTPTLAISL
jgi:hypothetical protein